MGNIPYSDSAGAARTKHQLDWTALDQALQKSTVLITANQRLARSLHQRYADSRQGEGKACWATPTILSWGAWLQNLWREGRVNTPADCDSRVLLSAQQANLVWERVIQRSRFNQGILNLQTSAASVAEAWTLLHAWRLPLPGPGDHASEDAAAFAEWAKDFKRECARLNAIDMAMLAAQLEECELELPATIMLIGFEQLTPAQERLLGQFEKQYCSVEQIALPPITSVCQRVVCRDSEDEFARAAGWARQHLSHNAQARIAIVVPDLHARRSEAERVFTDVMHPQHIMPGRARTPVCFNISLGPPLAQCPIIQAALVILRLAQGRVEAHDLGSLLRSPYIHAGQTEAAGRARLDLRLRERGDFEVWLADILGMARRRPEADSDRVQAPEFLAALEKLFVHHRAAVGKQTYLLWAERFTACLEAMGWPGERTLDSEEYQQRQAWHELLDSFASLDVVEDPVPFTTALRRLNQLAGEQLFQARTPWRPVQILGVLEAVEQQFDHLWLCTMDEENWPGQARPNAWLSLAQQRQSGMPHVDAVWELEHARRLTADFMAAAPDIVFSHAQWDDDRERQCSALVKHLPTELADNIAPADIHLLRNLIHATNDMEVIEDTQAPPLPAGPVRGGSSLIAAQAACPFQAFAKHRLHARALEEVSIGPDARQRGLLLHLALEKIWTGLHGHAQLCAQSETARVEIVNKALDAVLEQAVKQRPRTYTPRYTEIEKHVMCNLILTWLDLETQREPFTVQAREQAATLSLSGLELRVVMDRVDETQAGEQVILDYKTGKVSASGWEHERPDAPQLPMYALALRPAPAAVSFAQIRPGEVRLMGCASDSAALPGIKPEATAVWQTRLDEWQKNLIGLAAEYRAGYAAVSPKKRNLSCRYCDLTPLCRIHEVPEYGDQEDKQPTEPFDD